MTPQYLAARAEIRERRALSDYRTARSLWSAHLWSDAERRARALREALVAREKWTTLHELRREPVEVAERCDRIVNNGFGEPTECGRTLPCEYHLAVAA